MVDQPVDRLRRGLDVPALALVGERNLDHVEGHGRVVAAPGEHAHQSAGQLGLVVGVAFAAQLVGDQLLGPLAFGTRRRYRPARR